MPLPNCLSACYTGFFSSCDRNGDGKITAGEVLDSVQSVLKKLHSAVLSTSVYMQALKDAGFDTKGAEGILTNIQEITELSAVSIHTLRKIKITNLSELGDYNGDGVVDKHDTLAYLDDAIKVCDALIKAKVKPEEVTAFRDKLQNLAQIIRDLDPLAPHQQTPASQAANQAAMTPAEPQQPDEEIQPAEENTSSLSMSAT